MKQTFRMIFRRLPYFLLVFFFQGAAVVIGQEVDVQYPGGTSLTDGSATIDFGGIVVGSNSSVKTVTVRNESGANLTGVAAIVVGAHADDFVLNVSGLLSSIAAGSSSTFTVTFSPNAAGTRTATLQIFSNDTNENPFDVTLTGIGLAPEIGVEYPLNNSLTDGTASLNLGNVVVGTSSSVFTITVINTGGLNLTGVAVSKSGTQAGDFVLGGSLASTITPGNSSTFTVTFTPTAAGTRTASLQISSNDADENPFDITLIGTGLAPEIDLQRPPGTSISSGSSFDFGTLPVTAGLTSVTFTIKNLGTAALNSLAVTFLGGNSGDFTVTSHPAASLSPNATTTFTVQFDPSAPGDRTTELRVASNDLDENPFSVFLYGTGLDSSKLLHSAGQTGDNFGKSTGLFGNTAVVGAPGDDITVNANQGSATVFLRAVDGTYSQQAFLTAADGAAEDNFGASVAIDGDYVVVGAPFDDDQGTNSGSAYIFFRSAGTWSQQAKLTAGVEGAAGDLFGYSVAISGDTVIVGAPYDDHPSRTDQGSVYIFTRSGTNWSLQQKMTPSVGAANDYFGAAVAISGNTAVVGVYGFDYDADGPGGNPPNNGQGTAFVYVRTGSTWAQEAQLLAADGSAGDAFGVSVGIDGDSVVVGANLDKDNGTASGSAYTFHRSGHTWTQEAKLLAGDGTTGDSFGSAVSISGSRVTVGAPFDDDQGNDSGSVYFFNRVTIPSLAWVRAGKLSASDGAAGDNFGAAITLSGDYLTTGSPLDDDFGTDSGSARSFNISTLVDNLPAITVEQPVSTVLTNNDPVAQNFGEVNLDNGSASLVFTVRNTGSAKLTGLSYVIFGGSTGDYTVDTTGTRTTLNAGETTTVAVVFNPVSLGVRNSALRIGSNSSYDNPFLVNLTGTGVAPEIAVAHVVVPVTNEINLVNNTSGAYAEAGGQVVIEAENFASSLSNGDNTNWSVQTATAGFLGAGYIGTPNNGTIAASFASAAGANYQILFATPGTYYLWMRVFRPDADSDSAMIGLNGTLTDNSFDNTAANLNTWDWVMDGTIDVPTTGLHTLNIRRREDGYLIDRIILTTNDTATFTGGGPSESSRPMPIDFGAVDFDDPAGLTSRTFRISNSGTGPLEISSLTFSGTHASDFSLNPSVSNLNIPPGGNATITVEFNPSSSGGRTATLTLTNNDGDESSFNITLSGFGNYPEIDVYKSAVEEQHFLNSGTSTLDFGGVAVSGGTYTINLIIDNPGSAILRNVTFSATGDFSVSANPPLNQVGQGAGNRHTLAVTFDPSVVGLRTGTLTITSNDDDENPFTLALTGTGLVPDIAVKLPSGSSSPVPLLSWTLTGNGSAANAASTYNAADVNSSTITRGTGFTAAASSPSDLLGRLNSGSSGASTLAAAKSGQEYLQFTFQSSPGASYDITSLQLRTYSEDNNDRWTLEYSLDGFATAGTILQADASPGTGLQGVSSFVVASGLNNLDNADTVTFRLYFHGSAAAADRGLGGSAAATPDLIIYGLPSGAAYGFGNVALNTPVVKTFTIKNEGSEPLASIVVSYSGDPSFVLNTTTPPTASTLAPGVSTTFAITFTPTTAGPKAGTITITSNDPDESPFTLRLRGNGLTSDIQVSEGSTVLNSGSYPGIGSTPVVGGTITKTFTVTNTTGDVYDQLDALSGLAVTLTGLHAADYLLNLTGFPTVLPPQAKADFSVTFDPTAVGLRSCSISIASSDPDESPYTIPLQGNGLIPEISVDGGAITTGGNYNFGTVSLVGATASKTFSIANVLDEANFRNANLLGISAYIDGEHANDFTITAFPPNTLAPNANADLIVQYDPTGTGSRQAVLYIFSSDADENPFVINLSGGVLAPELDLEQPVSTEVADGDVVDFDYVLVSGSSRVLTFTVRNSGNSPLSITSITATGGHSSDFAVNSSLSTISAGGSGTFTVTFDPSASGVRTTTLSIDSDDFDEDPYRVTLRGIGIANSTLLAGDGAANDLLGRIVAADGEWMVAGAPSDGSKPGAAYIYRNNAGTWTQHTKLTDTGGANGEFFGSHVDIDGNTIIVGAPNDDTFGSASIYFYNGASWNLQQKIALGIPDRVAGDAFGNYVALSGDTALIGAFSKDANQGSVYVYTRSGGTWTQQARLVASDGVAGDNFGSSLAVDGDHALIGAWHDNNGSANQGSVYYFDRSGTTWTQRQKITSATTGANFEFGVSVAISGTTAIIGEQGDGNGKASVFTRTGSTWTLQQELSASDGAAGDRFGAMVDLKNNRAIIGANHHDLGGTNRGAAYLYDRSGSTWTQVVKFFADGAANDDNFGRGVALSGNFAFCGIPNDDVGSNVDQGSVDIFDLSVIPSRAPEIAVVRRPDNTQITSGDDIDFGSISHVGSLNIRKDFRVINTGTDTLTVTAVSITGPHAAYYTENLPDSFNLAPGTGRNFTIIFDPAAPGLNFSATLTLTNNDTDEPSFAIDLIGDGTAPEIAVNSGGEIADDSGIYNFGNVNRGFSSTVRTFTVSNSGNAPLTLDLYGMTLAGAHPGDFTVNTTSSVSVLQPGQNTTFTVVFTPQAAGLRSATLSFANNDTDENPFNFTLQGTGINVPDIFLEKKGELSSDPDTLLPLAGTVNFSYTAVNHSKVLTIEINNNGFAPLDLGAISSSSSRFVVNTTGLTDPLPVGGTTTFTVTFLPLAVGTVTGTITVPNNDPDEGSYTFTVSGIGTQPDIVVEYPEGTVLTDPVTTPIAFPLTNVGSFSQRTFLLKNTGDADLFLTKPIPRAEVSIEENFSGWTNPYGANQTPASGLLANLTNTPVGAIGTSIGTAQSDGFQPDTATFLRSQQKFSIGTGITCHVDFKWNPDNTATGIPVYLGLTSYGTDPAGAPAAIDPAAITATIHEIGIAVEKISHPDATTSIVRLVTVPNSNDLSSAGTDVSGGSTTVLTKDYWYRLSANIRAGTGAGQFLIDAELLPRGEQGTNLLDPLLSATGVSITDAALNNIPVAFFVITTDRGPSVLDNISVSANPLESNITLTGANADQFQFDSGVPQAVAPGGTRSLTVNFAPTSPGLKNATLQIFSNDPDESPFDIAISGNGVGVPEIAVEQPTGTELSSGVEIYFGIGAIGQAGTPKTFTITNPGSADLTGLAITKTGDHASDFAVSSLTSTTVNPTGGVTTSATFTVTFTPGASGPRTAALSIASNDADENPFIINLAGAGQPKPEITVERAGTPINDNDPAYHYGSVDTGASSSSIAFTVRNDGSASLSGLALSIDGSHPNDFTINQIGFAPSLSPSGTTTFSVTFAPSAPGARSATINIANNDDNENPFRINLSGTGVAVADIALEDSLGNDLFDNFFYSFGNVILHTPVARTFTIRNKGFANLIVNSISAPTGSGAANFAVSGFTGPVTLLPEASTTFTITFTPSAVGNRSAAIQILSTDSDENPFDLNLSGTGVLAPEIVVEQPLGTGLSDGSAITDFGSVQLGQSSSAFTYTIRNTGTGTLTGLSVSLVAPATPGTLTASGETGGHTAANTVDGNSSTKWKHSAAAPYYLEYRYDNGRRFALNSYTLVSANDLPASDPAAWTLYGTNAETPVFPADYTVVDTKTAQTFALRGEAKTFTLTNVPAYRAYRLHITAVAGGPGNADVQLAEFSLSPLNNFNEFTINTTGMNASVAPGASTTFTVTFTPGGNGVRNAQIAIASNDPDENPFDIALTGTGISFPEIVVEYPLGTSLADGAATIDFGTIAAGTTSSRSLVIKNTGNGNLTLPVNPFSFTGTAFTLDAATSLATSTNPTVIPPAGSFTATFIYTASSGTQTGSVAIASDDADENPFDINFTGTGTVAPEISVEQPLGTPLTDGVGTIHFGSIGLGAASAIRTFTITNTGSSNLTGLQLTRLGTNQGDFIVNSDPQLVFPFTLGSGVLAPAQSLTFTIQMIPSVAGTLNAIFRIASNDTDENPFDIAVTGTGVSGPEITLQAPLGTYINDAAAFDFGAIDQGLSKTQVFRIGNTGTAPLLLPAAAFVFGGTHSGDFALSSATQSLLNQGSPVVPAWADAARLNFRINFTTAGTYYVWVRRYAPTAADNSAQIHFDYEISGKTLDDMATATAWTWVQSQTLEVPSIGERTISLRRGEDGYAVDRLLLTTSGAFNPTGVGPAESAVAAQVFQESSGLVVMEAENRSSASQANDVLSWQAASAVAGFAGTAYMIVPNTLRIEAGATFDASIIFTPTALGARTATLAIANNDSDENPFDLTLSGTSIAPAEIAVEYPAGTGLTAGVSSVAFGSSIVGLPTAPFTFTIRNTGTGVLNNVAVSVVGTHPNDFQIVAAPATSVNPSGSTTFNVVFQPAANGSRTATLRIASSDADENPFDIVVTGTGTTAPEISVEQPENTLLTSGVSTVDFGPIHRGSSSVNFVFTVRNLGNANLTLTTPAITGAHSGDFVLNAAAFSTTLLPQGSTTFRVVFTPTAAGVRSATLSIPNNDTSGGENPFVISLSGVGVNVPEIAVEQPSGTNLTDNLSNIDFGSVNVGQSSSAYTFTIRNTGTADLTGLSISKNGGETADFVIDTSGMLATLTPGSSTTFTVTFVPTGAGNPATTLLIASNDADENPFRIGLRGSSGVVPEIVVEQPIGTNLVDGSASISFGSLNLGAASAPLTFTIRNIGFGNLSGLAVNKDGSGATDFIVDTSSLVTPLAPSGSTTFTVTFTPTAVGARAAFLRIISNDADENPFDIALNGTGVAAPEIQVEQPSGTILVDGSATIDLGAVALQGTSAAFTFIVKNIGTANLTSLAVGKSGAHASEFTVNTAGLLTSLVPSGSTAFSVTFSPAAVGARTATLQIASNDADENPFDITLIGTGLPIPEIDVQYPLGTSLTDGTASINFGTVNLGTGSPLQTITIVNAGGADLTGIAVSKSGLHANDFTIDTSGLLSTIPAGQSSTFTVSFAPAAAGGRSAALQITSNDSNENPFDISLSGTGVAAPEIVVEQPAGTSLTDGVSSIGFASVNIGANSILTVTVRNIGAGVLTGIVPAIDGAHSANFSVNTSAMLPTLSSGGSTTFTITFAPSFDGVHTANLRIASNDSDENPFDLALNGTGVAVPEIAVEYPVGVGLTDGSANLNFGAVGVSQSGTPFTVTVRNTGSAVLTGISVSKTDPHSDFLLQTTGLPASLLPNTSGTFTVTFTPKGNGPRTATLQIASNDADENPFDLSLSGTGVATQEISVANTTGGLPGTELTDNLGNISFGTIELGSSSMPISLTITNTGTLDLTGLALSLSGSSAGSYATSTLATTTLPPGASTTFTVTFTPTSQGTRNATLRIASNDADENPFDIALTGVGLVNAPAITQQPLPVSAQAGQNATFSVMATGTAPLSYQWRRNGAALSEGARISGSKTATLTITGLQTSDNGNYSVVISNAKGNVTSQNALLTVHVPVQITNQPTAQVVNAGDQATFTVTATGTNLSYQWYFNDSPLSDNAEVIGAQLASLDLLNVDAADAGNYKVVVSNSVSTVSSNVVTLGVNLPPTIVTQPQAVSTAVGQTVSLTVSATGTAPLYYQWKKNGANLFNSGRIAGATSPTLTISNAIVGDSGNYQVVVSNMAGSRNSNAAAVTVSTQAPQISGAAQNITADIGDTVTFSFTVTGSTPLTYQWRKNGQNIYNGGRISGANSTSLTIANLVSEDEGIYTLLATNTAGSTVSDDAVLHVNLVAPNITTHPQSLSLIGGESAVFSIAAVGTTPLSYQWYKNGQILNNGGRVTGATSQTLTIVLTTEEDAAGYTCTVTNIAGSATSQTAFLEVEVLPPVITTQPQSQQVMADNTVSFTATVAGSVPFTYQWYRNGEPLVNGGRITGADSNRLQITNTNSSDVGTYSLVVANTQGSTNSAEAVLAVVPNVLTKIGQLHTVTGALGLQISGNTVFLAQGILGIKVVNVADKSAPSIISQYNIVGSAQNLELVGQYAYVAYDGKGLKILNVANLSLPVLNGEFDSPGRTRNLKIAGSFAYLADDQAGLTIVDVSNPGSPSLRGALDTPGNVRGLALAGNLAYLAAGSEGLQVVDVSLPSNPVLLATVDTAGDARDVLVAGNRAYVADGTNGLLVFDLANPQLPVLVGHLDTDGFARTMEIFNRWIYLADGNAGLKIVDVTNPAQPALVTSYPSLNGTYDVQIQNNYVFLADTNAGLVILQQGAAASPTIVNQSLGLSLYEGETAQFTVAAFSTNLESLTYAWKKNGQLLSDGGQISGSSTAVLTIADVTTADVGAYTVEVSNLSGTVTSQPAVLSIVNNFAAWSAGKFTPLQLQDPDVSGPLATPNHDGLTNLEKYALGMNPFTYEPAKLPLSGFTAINNQYYATIQATVVPNDPNLFHRFEITTNFTTWHFNGDGLGGPYLEITETLLPDGSRRLTARSLQPLGAAPAILRLRFIQQE